MRTVHLATLVSITLAGAVALSCSEGDVDTMDVSAGAGQSPAGSMSGLPTAGPHLAGAPPSTANTMPSTSGSAASGDTTEPAAGTDGATDDGTTDADGSEEDSDEALSDDTSTDDTDATTGDTDENPDSAPPAEECTDVPPDDRESCATWAEWGECENANQWLADYCDLSCGRCQPGMSMAPPNGGPPNTPEGTPDDGDSNSGSTDNPGDTGNQNGSPELGDDNPFSPIDGGQQGHSTRYWDCCKPSCGWSNRPNAVDSCDLSGNNIGVNDQRSSVCPDGAGDAQTCHGMAPWAHSTTLSFGYAAVSQANCGTCWQLQFTGSAGNGGNNEGAAALRGKTMVVMASNTGSDVGAGQFDLLIPGGGVGMFDGCSRALGVQASEMGATYGGFRSQCANAGDQNGIKQCVRDMCTSVFGSRGFSDLEAGCLWYVDWFEAADNPDFVYQEVPCPAELREFN